MVAPDAAPEDYLWLARMVIRAALCVEPGEQQDAQQMRSDLEPYTDRLSIAGTGIAVLGFVSLATARLSASAGDLDGAIAGFRRSVRAHGDAGLASFVAVCIHDLANTFASEGRIRRRRGGKGSTLPKSTSRPKACACGSQPCDTH